MSTATGTPSAVAFATSLFSHSRQMGFSLGNANKDSCTARTVPSSVAVFSVKGAWGQELATSYRLNPDPMIQLIRAVACVWHDNLGNSGLEGSDCRSRTACEKVSQIHL